jgi:NAD+ synthase (glutamine-hydrolysing)
LKSVKVAAAALNQTPLDWDHNANNIADAIRLAKAQNVSVLCLPELCITGYGCEDAFHAPGTAEMALAVLEEMIPHTEEIIVAMGLPIMHRGGLFNCGALLANGKIIGLAGKQNLAGRGLHYEPRWFKSWPNDAQGEIPVAGGQVPIGDLLFDCGGIRIGFEICEDAWVRNRTGEELAQQRVDILLNPSASHFAFGKHVIRRRLVLDGSRSFFATYVYANLLGNEAGRAIYGGDTMIASCGTLLASGRRLTYRDHDITTAVIDIDSMRMDRLRSGRFPVDVKSPLGSVVTTDFSYPQASPEPSQSPDEWETSEHLKEEEFTRAVCLGLFDYLRKSRSHGFTVSLSGGADSSAVATLVALAIQLACQDLGMAGVRRKLSHIEGVETVKDANELTKLLLTCAYQSTRNSSDTTRDAATAVATALHANFLHLEVDHLVEGYKTLISDAIGRPLTWERDDLTLQNIQARARGPSIWMLANLRNSLLLATSNRSEAAVGYATMDGDTCGGLSPIAGIDKAFLRKWLRWMETDGPEGLANIPALAAVNAQAPTAELRPPDAQQEDEKDLMPYEILDLVERSAIRDKRSPCECFQTLRQSHPEIPPVQMAVWIERFFVLWCRNQWKRERYAPCFHVDDENLDPKTWCRFPILSGGFERELAELDEHVKNLS